MQSWPYKNNIRNGEARFEIVRSVKITASTHNEIFNDKQDCLVHIYLFIL